MAPPDIVTLPAPLNAVAVAPDGEIVTGGADGKVRFLSRGQQGRSARCRRVPTPIVALAISPDGARVAAAGIGGTVNLIDRKTRSVDAHAGRAGTSGLVGCVSCLMARRC